MILHVHGLGAPQKVRHIAGEVRVLVRLCEDCFSPSQMQVSAAIRHEQVHVISQNSLIAPLLHVRHMLEANPVVVFIVNARIMPVGHMLSHVLSDVLSHVSHTSVEYVSFVVDHEAFIDLDGRACSASYASYASSYAS